MPKLTYDRLKELLIYDPETGVFTWRICRRGTRAGSVAGRLDKHGYREICLDGKVYFASRLAFFYMKGVWPVHQIDHKNVTPGDDRWENLREATQEQNSGNKRTRRDTLLGVKGVKRNPKGGRYLARFRDKYLGSFDSIEEASEAYRLASEAAYGEFSRV